LQEHSIVGADPAFLEAFFFELRTDIRLTPNQYS